MKKFILIAALVFVVGCTEDDWEKVEKGAAKVQTGASTGQEIATVSTPWTGQYGLLASTVLGAFGTIAGAVKAFAANRKKEKLAKAAVIAADVKPGVGEDLNNAAALLNVGEEIRAAYEAMVKEKG